ncbi:hypothetical protein Pan216_34830 [Planctomycetes bacterium Pan216]|uniref:3-keto-disaccharide hydrolase domain-containing protein n=1 Tax=Kolteria novifilia TaxID=2527975 RepID=A0A518B6M1_9BACT|nr:hypothetical protein Pan216_34830 [Planctomycetes bacterium Pan216]
MRSMLSSVGTLAITLSIGSIGLADDDRGQLIFQDDFERNESQEEKDEVGKGWKTNSKSRAAGNKQVDLRDGTMFVYIHKVADHAVSVNHPFEFTDGAIELRFKLDDKKDSLGLNFADPTFKDVHAGHLFDVRITPRYVLLSDLKTGKMIPKIRDMRRAKTLPPELQSMLKTKERRIPNTLETGKWHDLLVTVKGDQLTASIDGKKIGSFSSEGIAHPTKKLLRLSVPRNATVDDVKMYRGS